jgi:hypothetical protein
MRCASSRINAQVLCAVKAAEYDGTLQTVTPRSRAASTVDVVEAGRRDADVFQVRRRCDLLASDAALVGDKYLRAARTQKYLLRR